MAARELESRYDARKYVPPADRPPPLLLLQLLLHLPLLLLLLVQHPIPRRVRFPGRLTVVAVAGLHESPRIGGGEAAVSASLAGSMMKTRRLFDQVHQPNR